MSRAPNWLLDFALTFAHWAWRNKYLVALITWSVLAFAYWCWRSAT